MLPDHRLEKVIECTQPVNHTTSFTWYKSGIAVTGPNKEIRVSSCQNPHKSNNCFKALQKIRLLVYGLGNDTTRTTTDFNIQI